jgi:REP element-mobilizing transposase RayT
MPEMKVEYHNLYTHFVFTTFHRAPLIPEKNRIRIEKYITGIVNNNGCKMYSIYANPDHLHFLVSRAPNLDDELLATIVANSSEKFINDNNLVGKIFQWQSSCSAFSVSKADINKICKYILNQPNHHKQKSSQQEHQAFIKFYQKTLKPK